MKRTLSVSALIFVISAITMASFGEWARANITRSSQAINLYLPFSNSSGDVRISRTGLLYRSDYDAAGLSTVSRAACAGFTTAYCLGSDGEYHDFNDSFNFVRGAIDFALPYGAKVLAAADGKVRSDTGMSNCQIVIEHSDGTVAYYLHVSAIFVSANQTVKRGQHIGNVGAGCGAVGAHLHFALYKGGTEIKALFVEAQTDGGVVRPSRKGFREYRYRSQNDVVTPITITPTPTGQGSPITPTPTSTPTSTPVPPISSTNLLVNPSYESGDSTNAADWLIDFWDPNGSEFSIDSSVIHSGNRSVKITSNKVNDARWMQKVSVSANTDYRLSGWIKTSNVAVSTQAVNAGANLSILGGWVRSEAVLGTTDWKEVSFEFNTGPSTVITVAARLGFYSGTTDGTAWFDDLKLTPKTALPPKDDPLDCTVSINDGAIYTNSPDVVLRPRVSTADQMRLSNDGSFANTQIAAYTSPINWTLNDPGKRIATLIAYARFSASGQPLCGGATILDDIVYDPLPPTLTASLVIPAENRHQRFAPSDSSFVELNINASDQDGGSGISEMQVSTSPDFEDAAWQPYTNTLVVDEYMNNNLYVRVRDWANNVSVDARVQLTTNAVFLPVIIQ